MRKRKMVMVGLGVSMVVFGMIMIKLVLNVTLNEIAISRYRQGRYEDGWLKQNLILNVFDGYVAYYNLGDIYYEQEKYREATEAFEKALELAPESAECKIRGNLALAKFGGMDVENERKEDLAAEMREIAEMLLVNDCARAEGDGRDARDQMIYDAIMETLDGESGGGDGDDEEEAEKETEGEEGDGEDSKTEKEIRSQLEAASYEANNQYDFSDYEYYEGKVW